MTQLARPIPDRFVYAAIAISLTMMSAILWMPSYLGVLHEGYGIEVSRLGNLAFAEMGGFLLGTLFTSTRTIPQLKRWVLIGCAALAVVNILLMIPGSTLPFILVRPITGLAAGIGCGYGLKLCGASRHPTRSFGVSTALMSFVMLLGFQFIAWLIENFGMSNGAMDREAVKNVARIIFGTCVVLAAVAAVVILTNQPPLPADQGHAAVKPQGMLEPKVLVGLLAILLSFIGHGGIWAFLQVLGSTHGFTVAGVANAMSIFAVSGIVGSLVSAAVPPGPPRSLFIGIALLALFGGLYTLYVPASLAWYIIGCAIGGFYWNFILPLILGLLAQADRTGRGSVLGGAMSSGGSAMGPLIAGMMIQGSNYQPAGWMAAGLCGVALLCVRFMESRKSLVTVSAIE